MLVDTMEDVIREEDQLVSIRDAARIIGVPAHTLRYWEKEFADYLIPPRTQGKQRRYGDEQIDRLRNIFRMLKEEGYSIAGAKRSLRKQHLKENSVVQPAKVSGVRGSSLDHLSTDMAQKIMALVRSQLMFS